MSKGKSGSIAVAGGASKVITRGGRAMNIASTLVDLAKEIPPTLRSGFAAWEAKSRAAAAIAEANATRDVGVAQAHSAVEQAKSATAIEQSRVAEITAELAHQRHRLDVAVELYREDRFDAEQFLRFVALPAGAPR